MSKLKELNSTLSELKRRRTENKLAYYEPYPKQREFHDMGLANRERLFSAGNQLGKTWAGGMEMAYHLTGLYPHWWAGQRFDRPLRAWAAGTTSEATRDTVQRVLLGPTKPYGEGAIPKDLIVVASSSRGIADAVDTLQIRHARGGVSTISFKSYEKGREKWQGETLDLVWMDEEPPAALYTEALARITARRGRVYVTFTPLLGMSEVVRRFYEEEHPDRGLVRMTIEDVGHISVDDRAQIIAGYPAHERDARVRGLPMLGSGRVYPIVESAITVESFALPEHWPRIVGIDFGWDHPTAAAWLAWDRDTDTVYVTDTYVASETTIAVNAAAVRSRGADVPIAWPHDGLQSDKSSGLALRDLYAHQGLRMLDQRATFEGGGSSVEAGILDLLDRMQTGRLKVFGHLADWLAEFRLYHRKNGRIVKERDDLLDATRYAVMMLREARLVHNGRRVRRRPVIARDLDYDLFAQ